MLIPKFLLPLQLWLVLVVAQRAIRVDDDSTEIVYTPAGAWARNEVASDLDAGGFHMLATDAAATATFSFIGTGIAFMAPLWAEAISARVTLDGGAPVDIDMLDPTQTPTVGGPATVASAILWSELDLPNVQHNLVISVPPGDLITLVDMLIFYVPDTTTSTTSTTSATSTTETTRTPTTTTGTDLAASTSDPPVSSGTKMGLSIALGVVCSVFGLLALTVGFFCWRRRQRRLREQDIWAKTVPDPPPMMDEIDDSLAAGRGRRYKSRPTAKSLAASELAESSSGLTSPSGIRPGSVIQQGHPSKLRNVVASQEPTIAVVPRSQHTRASSDPRAQAHGHTRSHSEKYGRAPSPRKFTLEPDESNPLFRT
ncbi:hypothetical protein MD484_g5238, partial [Candolleomyces efflorescens]